jgi:CNT family concentrative nucleoside transporter
MLADTLMVDFVAAISPSASGSVSQRLQCLLGLVVFLALSFGIGRIRYRSAPIPWRAIGWGLVLQFAFAVIVLRAPGFLEAVNAAIDALLGYTREGAKLLFGNLVYQDVPVVSTTQPTRPVGVAQTSAFFGFFVLPTIIFFSALTAILYHLGVMQWVVQGLAWVMSRTMKTSGAETLSAAANIFVGQTEAPLMVKPFLSAMTNSELMCVMVAGFANIATGVLGAYTEMLKRFVPDVGGHLAAACFVSAPASLLVSKLLVPETGTPGTAGGVEFKVERLDANVLDATARGTFEGLTLALNVGAMLIAFTALVAMLNGLIGWAAGRAHFVPGGEPLTLERMFGWVFSPVAWLTGISHEGSPRVGELIGIKTVLNEFVAYSQMSQRLGGDANWLGARDALIATYALCGFANFASVGIQIGGISTMAPGRRQDLSRLALLAMVGGAIASHMTACVVGVLV